MTKKKNQNAQPLAAEPRVFPAGSAKARDVVTVGLKTPNGLLLRLMDFTKVQVPVLGGGTREESRAFQVGDMVRLHGSAVPVGATPACLIVGGYALTPNVDKSFIQKWMEQNKDHDVLKNNLMFIASDRSSAMDQAKEQKETRHGLEPLNQDPKKELRVGKRQNKNITDIEKSDVVGAEA